jgi:hypothetical protein
VQENCKPREIMLKRSDEMTNESLMPKKRVLCPGNAWDSDLIYPT